LNLPKAFEDSKGDSPLSIGVEIFPGFAWNSVEKQQSLIFKSLANS
jgi:hypothetical protein